MVSKEEIILLNKRILIASGAEYDFFGFVNEGNLDYAINKANHQDNPIGQATTLMHEIIRGQPFTNANKRTGFETAMGVLASGGYVCNATQEEIVPFVKSINISGLPVTEVKDWITVHINPSGQVVDFSTASEAMVIRDKEMLKKMD